MDFAGKVCVVTGASSGIGRRTAADLAAAGARLCLVARREDRLKEVLGEIGGAPRHSVFVADVSSRRAAEDLAEHVRSTYGRCDVLINNAGFSRPGTFDRENALEDLEAVMRTNFFGAAYVTKALLSLLEASAPSHVVNVASVAGRHGMAGSTAYCASKFALIGWSESLGAELARRGVHVGVVEPGPVPTEGFPQSALVNSGIMRLAVASTADVSKAIRQTIARGKAERVVPRWYFLLELPRLLFPPFYRLARDRILSARSPDYPR